MGKILEVTEGGLCGILDWLGATHLELTAWDIECVGRDNNVVDNELIMKNFLSKHNILEEYYVTDDSYNLELDKDTIKKEINELSCGSKVKPDIMVDIIKYASENSDLKVMLEAVSFDFTTMKSLEKDSRLPIKVENPDMEVLWFPYIIKYNYEKYPRSIMESNISEDVYGEIALVIWYDKDKNLFMVEPKFLYNNNNNVLDIPDSLNEYFWPLYEALNKATYKEYELDWMSPDLGLIRLDM